jgi:metal-responsive CopG/Arc/MetJ family transcriptional regulator
VKNEKSSRFEMVIPAGWMDAIDSWRAKQPGIPSRAEAIRRLVDKGLSER